jgi:hypothetical protein
MIKENPAFWLLAATVAIVMARAGHYLATRKR